jgi:uncharacterized protein (UPF0276 family)
MAMQLTASLAGALVDLIRANDGLVDAAEFSSHYSLEEVRDYRRALPELPFHFHSSTLIQQVGQGPGIMDEIHAYLALTESPWFSAHIIASDPDAAPDTVIPWLVQQVRRLEVALEMPVILENMPGQAWDGGLFVAEPKLITQVIEETGCRLLLDTAHARIAAARLHMDVHDYLARLPLSQTAQIHVCGPRLQDGVLFDAHEALQEEDYTLLDWVLARADPQVLTLEYWQERDPLRKQLYRLRALCR